MKDVKRGLFKKKGEKRGHQSESDGGGDGQFLVG